MKYSLITAEWIEEDYYPVIYLIARDENKEKVMVQIKGYLPYFYINAADAASKKLPKYSKREPIFNMKTLFHQEAIDKIYFRTPDALERGAYFLKKQHCRLYEADLSDKNNYPLRYLIDKGIKNGFTHGKDNNPVPVEVEYTPYRIYYIDIECLSYRTGSVSPYSSDIINIIGVYDNYRNKYRIYYLKSDKNINVNFPDLEIVECETEKDLLKKFMTDLENDDPDILTAHNLDRFDLPKLIARIKANKLKISMLSPAPFRRVYKGRGGRYVIKGRIIFDLMKAYIQLTGRGLPSYSLEYICNNKEYGEGLKIPFVKINKSYKEDWEEDPSKVIKLNYWHVKGIKRYDESADVISFFDEIKREAGCLLNQTLSRKKILDTALLRLGYNRYVFPTETKFITEDYEGGNVLDTIPGLHKNVISIDLSRAYPNIIIAFNISGDTLSTSGAINIDGIYRFDSIGIRKGIVVELLESWVLKREEKKQLKFEAEKNNDKELSRKYKRQENSIKYTCNAAYGVMAYKSFRGFKISAAAAITYLCRKGMEFAVLQLRNMGYEVIYGDTDSIFFKAKGEDILQEAKITLKELNKRFRTFVKKYKIKGQPFQLDLQKIYSEFWLVEAKKKYGGRVIWENGIFKKRIEIKGWEKVRSDASSLERKMTEDFIIMKLDEISREIKWKYWNEIKIKLDNNNFSIYEIGYPARVTKSIRRYGKPKGPSEWVGIPAHIKAVLYSNKYLNTDFIRGSKPLRVPIDYKKLRIYPITFQDSFTIKEYVVGKPNKEFVERNISFKIRDIAIDTDTRVPKEFMEAIDWKRIYERLNKKVNRLFKEKIVLEEEIKEKVRLKNILDGYLNE